MFGGRVRATRSIRCSEPGDCVSVFFIAFFCRVADLYVQHIGTMRVTEFSRPAIHHCFVVFIAAKVAAVGLALTVLSPSNYALRFANAGGFDSPVFEAPPESEHANVPRKAVQPMTPLRARWRFGSLREACHG